MILLRSFEKHWIFWVIEAFIVFCSVLDFIFTDFYGLSSILISIVVCIVMSIIWVGMYVIFIFEDGKS
jgi:hypothetical protein